MNAQSHQDEFNWFWTELDEDITSSLTDDQKLALTTAARKSGAKRRPADIRFSVFGYFFVLICGHERRDKARVKLEAKGRPVVTFENIPMLIGIWSALIFTTWSFLGFVSRVVFGS